MAWRSARTSCNAAVSCRVALFALLGCVVDAFAAHPLLTEDTGTQGVGKLELELGNARTRDQGDRLYEFAPQLSYGVLPNLDAIARPTWVDSRTTTEAGVQRARGAGDAALDIKWRFYEAEGLSFGARAGVNAPVGDADRGLGAGTATYHALSIMSIDAAPWAVHANLAYTRNRAHPAERRNLYRASAAALWSFSERWQLLLADLAVDTNIDRSRSAALAVARVGAICTIKPGFDIDVGWQFRLNRAAPVQVLLAAATLRW